MITFSDPVIILSNGSTFEQSSEVRISEHNTKQKSIFFQIFTKKLWVGTTNRWILGCFLKKRP
jgi:hypothetical protein